MKGFKVVTATEMARVEKQAFKAGFSEAGAMEKAGASIAQAAELFILNYGMEKKITVVAGKGNNGGDAFVAGRLLEEKGYEVAAYHPYDLAECSPLCRKQAENFKKSGGKISKTPHLEGLLLDGLVGTGFKGKPDAILAEAIKRANESGYPILAIDIPSGVNGTTGAVESVAIHAAQTIFLGLPKLGFFIGEGWNHVGHLVYGDFGLPEKFVQAAKASGFLPHDEMIEALLPPIKRTRHKYQAGYVLAVAGSPGMGGAAILATYAVLRSGAGIVRLFHPKEIANELFAAPYVIIKENYELAKVVKESKRAKSILVGPGLGRNPKAQVLIKNLLAKISIQCVLDADVLYFLAEHPKAKLPKNAILTPHHEEMKRLLGKEPTYANCQAYVEAKKTTVVLKGAPTVVFHPGMPPLIITRGDPGMATAGSGDVLTGIIASFCAQGLQPYAAAVLGVYIHGKAGEAAAFEKTSYCMIASDIIECLPFSF